MLFHSFRSQAERRKFGGSDFIQLTFCKLKRGTAIEEIVSNDAVIPLAWNDSSLYIYGDDWNDFYDAYGEIITDGTYSNFKTGYLDWCGINYFSPEQAACIINKIQKEKPSDYQSLLAWLENGTQYNGFYVLGV